MTRLVASALAAAVTIALPATAFAETLDYDFTMRVTSVSGDAGVFGTLDVDDTIHVDVTLDVNGNGTGTTQISVSELSVTGTSDPYTTHLSVGTWGVSTGTKIDAESVVVNQIDPQTLSVVSSTTLNNGASYTQSLWLSFSGESGGVTSINTGGLTLNVGNHLNGTLNAVYVDSPPPTSVPELDPKSGTGAIALLVGGMALAFSRRRRQQCDGVAG